MVATSFPLPPAADTPKNPSRKTKKQLHQELIEYRAAVLKLPIIAYQSGWHRANINKIWKLISQRHSSPADIAEAAMLMLARRQMPTSENFDWGKDFKLRMGVK